jgi:cytochrome c oxidase cbb3-type subunit IV
MDITMVHIVWTVATFIVFIAIVLWACSGRAQRGFEQAAMLPFDDEPGGGAAGTGGTTGSGR